MNTKRKLISDIRFYENPVRTEHGNVRHRSLGSVFQIPYRSFSRIGDRFACKLREHKFMLPGFDHLYVVLTPALECGVVGATWFTRHNWIRSVDVGLSREYWDSLDVNAKHDQLVDLTCMAIAEFPHEANTLETVAMLLKRDRSQTEIVVKTKETASYRVDISFQIRPLQKPSVAFLSCVDKRSGQDGKVVLFELSSPSDVYPLCGSIAVRADTITIKPRSSFRASLTAKEYGAPVSIGVEYVLSASRHRTND